MKIKFIITTEDDQLRLEKFLNQESEKGWHATKITRFYIKFNYDKNIRYYYYVLSKHSVRNQKTGPTSLSDHEEFMMEFNFTKISNDPLLLVYRSDQKLDLFTDNILNEETIKSSIKRLILGHTLYLASLLLGIYTNLNQGFYYLLISNSVQIAVMFLIAFSMITLKKILTYLLGKGKLFNNKLNYRWHPYLPDPNFLFLMGLLVYLFFLIMPNVYMALGLFFPIITLIPIYFYIQHRNPAKVRKFIYYTIATLLIMNVSFNLLIESSRRSKPENIYVNESWLAKEIHDFTDPNYITTVEIKTDFISNSLVDKFVKRNRLPSGLEKGKLHKLENEYDYVRYFYWDESKIILSDEQLPADFYESFPNDSLYNN